METTAPAGPGWFPDLPDPRDFRPTDSAVRALLAGLPRRPTRAPRPAAVSWEEFLGPADGQPGPWAAAAGAGVALAGYFDRRAHGRARPGSALFLHTMAHRIGPGGCSLRATFKALKRFGLPPAEHWPPDPARRDAEPPGFLFAYAREFQDLAYVRLDPGGVPGRAVLAAVKAYLGAGLPVAFGFTVFDPAGDGPDLPCPTCYDAPAVGQAGVAVGYDDGRRVRSERGALRVRGPWGPAWGEGGSGWLPYRYVTDRLAADFWALLRPDWLAAGDFTSPV